MAFAFVNLGYVFGLKWSNRGCFLFLQSQPARPCTSKIRSPIFCHCKSCRPGCFLGSQRDHHVTCI